MATVNIAADMNEAETVTIADAGAAAGSHLFQFFTDGKNVFNIATQDLSGAAVDEVTVNVNTSYVFIISAAQAQLLNGVASTYKQYLLDGEGGKTLKNEGSVTVTPLTGGALAELSPFINGDRITNLGGAVAAYTALNSDDVIYCSPANLVETVITLPPANKVPGKRFKIKLATVSGGTVSIITDDATELIALATFGDNCEVISRGLDADDWQLFAQFVQP